MAVDLLFEKLDKISDMLLRQVSSRWEDLSFPEAAGFAVTRVTHDPQNGSSYFCSTLVESTSGIKIPLVHRLHDSDISSLNAADFVEAALVTIANLQATRVGDVYCELLNTIVDLLGSNCSAEAPLRLISLDALPVGVGGIHAAPGFEANLQMLSADLAAKIYVMKIKDARDFRDCFFAEILPEQRARAAGMAGYDVPEAVND
ncbi:hypothetical protein [Sphingomonas hankookensis]|uniref:hypothetical protein n=1 Tax=Sphingomonas hankookensis TaxID=563996 RepID=UPI00234FB300|nr:hypothetical protein [Sphingomonas hankookensis]WCP73504.1 hypothetical protein PPZ50_08180 [Sphingomonas hankookensis]